MTNLDHSDKIMAAKQGDYLVAVAPVGGVDMSKGGVINYATGSRFRVEYPLGNLLFCFDDYARSVTFDREDMASLALSVAAEAEPTRQTEYHAPAAAPCPRCRREDETAPKIDFARIAAAALDRLLSEDYYTKASSSKLHVASELLRFAVFDPDIGEKSRQKLCLRSLQVLIADELKSDGTFPDRGRIYQAVSILLVADVDDAVMEQLTNEAEAREAKNAADMAKYLAEKAAKEEAGQ